MFEPKPGENVEERNSEESSSSGGSSDDDDDSFNDVFEIDLNAWRLSTLSWCKCGHCGLTPRTIESFCCHEKATEYDEYDNKLKSAQDQGFTCVTQLPSFTQNISHAVLDVDALQYVEENWPLGDEELARMHKIYRLVGYRRCSRWIFQVLGKKCRRPFPACIYKYIREKFSSPDGLYTYFKFPKS